MNEQQLMALCKKHYHEGNLALARAIEKASLAEANAQQEIYISAGEARTIVKAGGQAQVYNRFNYYWQNCDATSTYLVTDGFGVDVKYRTVRHKSSVSIY